MASKNILVLGLSTFNGKQNGNNSYLRLEESKTYIGEGIFSNYELDGFYQLEPVPKMLSRYLEAKGEKLDVIITMNTSEVDAPKRISVSCLNEEIRDFSPAEFFEFRLSCGDMAVSRTHFPEIIPIKSIEKNYYAGIFSAITDIRNRKEKGEGDLHLWVDDHGGFREMSMAVQAIISLLRHESIPVEAIFTVKHEHGADTVDRVMTVKNTGIFDFVSGMNEFSYYGKSEGLLEFVKEETPDNQDKRNFVKNMNRISDAIQLCDMSLFENTLSRLGEWIGKYSKTGNDPMDIFIDNIKMDYGDLLNNDKRTVLAEIKWCLKKGYLQQALTLIESKIPEEFCRLKIIRLDKDEEVIIYQSEDDGNGKKYWKCSGEKIKLSKALLAAKKKSQKEWESDINYLFPMWCRNNTSVSENREKSEYVKLNMNQDEYQIIPVTAMYERLKCRRFLFVYYDGNKRVKAFIKVRQEVLETPERQKMFNRILMLHLSLKNQRNTTNHAIGGDRYSAKNIRDAIGAYVDLVERLYKICEVKIVDFNEKTSK